MNPQVERDGFALITGVLDPEEQQALLTAIGPLSAAGQRGLRHLAAIADLARSDRLLQWIRPHLARDPRPARVIYFDKSPAANWLVPWHQDLTLALRSRADLPGFGPWSFKDGIPHVQPPVALLEQMLTIRIHLDDTDHSNGALRVLPATHTFGRLSAERIQELRTQLAEVTCEIPAGGAMLMRPLLLHASSRSTTPRHRRVLHIEYAAFDLPPGLDWHEAP